MYEEEAKIEKMSEKICQLTRVVYLLHSKNSDSQSSIESIISSYDEEINFIVKEGNNTISILKNKLLQLESPERMKAKFEEIKETLSTQYQSTLSTKANELIEVFRLKEETIEKDYNAKVESMKGEVKEIKEALVLYKEKTELSQQNEYNKAIDDIRKESHKQIETLIITYEDMSQQKENSLTELTKKNKELNSQIEQLRSMENEYKMKIEDFSAKNKARDNHFNQLANDNAAKATMIIEKENEYKNRIKELNLRISEYDKELNQQKELNDKCKKQCFELKRDLKESKSLLLQVELKYESTTIDKDVLDGKLNLVNHQMELLEQSAKELRELYSNESKANESLIADNSNLQNQLMALESKAKKIEEANKAQIELLSNRLKESDEKWKKKILAINELKGSHQSEINQMKFSFQTTIDEMKRVKTTNDHSSQEVQRLKMLLYEEKMSLESKHREEIDRISFKYSMTINELKNKYNEDLIIIKQENAKGKDRLNSYEKEMKKKQEEFKLNQIEHFQKMKHDFMDALNIQQEKNYNLTNEINDLENYLANRPSREEDIAEISKLREELNAKDNELKELKYVLQQFKSEPEGKEEFIPNSLSLQGKNVKKIKIVNPNSNGSPNEHANPITNSNGGKETPSSGNGNKKISSFTLKNPKYTNANYGMIFSKK